MGVGENRWGKGDNLWVTTGPEAAEPGGSMRTPGLAGRGLDLSLGGRGWEETVTSGAEGPAASCT